ncbi:universal stress protein [Mariniblastus fucicola]|uniref:Universal stress protein n=1 Tax=Mariniblastus fucicola TaxID=980251 RepID=A0A5B9PC88_9BACT|nr:universal stress protein [Mariniblastus fucicola]QEG22542.1 Stress response protein NhaX [Mariniblastus fucicola]
MKQQNILCPVDFSGSSEPAVDLAARLAVAEKSKIWLLHIVESNEPAVSMDEASLRNFSTQIEDQYLSQQNIDYEHVTLHGKPAEKIVEFAKKRSIDLIFMGTHGRTGLARVVVGSVAQNVMANASCPVVTVKSPA